MRPTRLTAAATLMVTAACVCQLPAREPPYARTPALVHFVEVDLTTGETRLLYESTGGVVSPLAVGEGVVCVAEWGARKQHKLKGISTSTGAVEWSLPADSYSYSEYFDFQEPKRTDPADWMAAQPLVPKVRDYFHDTMLSKSAPLCGVLVTQDLAGIDIHSGKPLWRVPAQVPADNIRPKFTTLRVERDVVIASDWKRVLIIDRGSGKELFSVPPMIGFQRFRVSACAADDHVVMLVSQQQTSRSGGKNALLRIDRRTGKLAQRLVMDEGVHLTAVHGDLIVLSEFEDGRFQTVARDARDLSRVVWRESADRAAAEMVVTGEYLLSCRSDVCFFQRNGHGVLRPFRPVRLAPKSQPKSILGLQEGRLLTISPEGVSGYPLTTFDEPETEGVPSSLWTTTSYRTSRGRTGAISMCLLNDDKLHVSIVLEWDYLF